MPRHDDDNGTSEHDPVPGPTDGQQGPGVTLYFWIIKILCTTVGETAANYMKRDLEVVDDSEEAPVKHGEHPEHPARVTSDVATETA